MKADKGTEQTSKFTDDDWRGDLQRRLDAATRIEECVGAGHECPVLEILESLSRAALSECAEVDPEKLALVIGCQQRAKMLDTIIRALKNKYNKGLEAGLDLEEINQTGE